jgi:hypothetical protein
VVSIRPRPQGQRQSARLTTRADGSSFQSAPGRRARGNESDCGRTILARSVSIRRPAKWPGETRPVERTILVRAAPAVPVSPPRRHGRGKPLSGLSTNGRKHPASIRLLVTSGPPARAFRVRKPDSPHRAVAASARPRARPYGRRPRDGSTAGRPYNSVRSLRRRPRAGGTAGPAPDPARGSRPAPAWPRPGSRPGAAAPHRPGREIDFGVLVPGSDPGRAEWPRTVPGGSGQGCGGRLTGRLTVGRRHNPSCYWSTLPTTAPRARTAP